MNIENPKANEVPTSEKAHRLFGHSFVIDRFENNDEIPVGGDNIFSQEANIKIEGDFNNFSELYQEAGELSKKYDLVQLGDWLKSLEIDMEPRLFATLFAFTAVYGKHYPHNAGRAQTRNSLYKDMAKGISLSDVFKANAAHCAEIAALAQYYLQSQNIDSAYISGDVLWNKQSEFSEEHSFLEIKDGERAYLYDPTNPVDTTQGIFPSIYTTEVDFDQEIRKGHKKFITAKNIISKNEAYYGINDGTNIDSERDIV